MPTAIEPRRLPLGTADGNRYPQRFLVLDFDGSEYRAAFWWLRSPREQSQSLALTAPPERAWENAVERNWVPAKDRRHAWGRLAAKGTALDDVLRLVFEGSRIHWRAIADYVRLTSWGDGLP